VQHSTRHSIFLQVSEGRQVTVTDLLEKVGLVESLAQSSAPSLVGLVQRLILSLVSSADL